MPAGTCIVLLLALLNDISVGMGLYFAVLTFSRDRVNSFSAHGQQLDNPEVGFPLWVNARCRGDPGAQTQSRVERAIESLLLALASHNDVVELQNMQLGQTHSVAGA